MAPKATLRPVALATEDLLVDAEDPAELAAAALDAATGEPVPGVDLRFRRQGEGGAALDLAAITDTRGVVRVRVPASGYESTPEILRLSADERFLVSIAGPPHVLLASPWRGEEPAARLALLDVVRVASNTAFLLVDLDGWRRACGEGWSAWSSPPTPLFVDRAEAGGGLEGRALYVATEEPTAAQRVKFWLASTGLRDGLVLLCPRTKAKGDWLASLASRLERLDSRVVRVLCAADDRSVYSAVFPGAALATPFP
ncbi:MAG: hypothetical protein HY721_17935 [Planctomycetes bacterium]|nr:hypothetical protein [Planctomycetota bacterium]